MDFSVRSQLDRIRDELNYLRLAPLAPLRRSKINMPITFQRQFSEIWLIQLPIELFWFLFSTITDNVPLQFINIAAAVVISLLFLLLYSLLFYLILIPVDKLVHNLAPQLDHFWPVIFLTAAGFFLLMVLGTPVTLYQLMGSNVIPLLNFVWSHYMLRTMVVPKV
jgi:membrane protein YdbS with pleckstrin-like domain